MTLPQAIFVAGALISFNLVCSSFIFALTWLNIERAKIDYARELSTITKRPTSFSS
jgi:hypothetical protein